MYLCNRFYHGLRTPREEIAFTTRPKTQSQSQIFRYGGSIFSLPHRPNFSDIFDLCCHRVSVVRAWAHCGNMKLGCSSKKDLTLLCTINLLLPYCSKILLCNLTFVLFYMHMEVNMHTTSENIWVHCGILHC